MSLNSSLYVGSSGLRSFATGLTVVADNIANSGTTGFKANQARFADLVSTYYITQGEETDRQGSGSTVLSVSTDFAQGSSINTTEWSDMLINGSGFFNVQQPGSDITYYTRDGGFHVDSSGYLVNSEGYQVLGTDGNAVQVETDPSNPVYSSYSVDSNGQIYGTPAAGGDSVAIGSPLRISTFPNQDGLIRCGQNLYTPGPEAGTAVDGQANTGICGAIVGSAIEGSNVDLASEMVNMIAYQASYNANSKIITTANSLLDTTVNMVR